MTQDDAVTVIERLAHTEAKWPGTEDTLEALSMAVNALRTTPALRNDPLTIEQLQEMDGEPVWVTPLGFWALVIAKPGERVKLISNDGEIVYADKEIELVGPVYRRPPEGERGKRNGGQRFTAPARGI